MSDKARRFFSADSLERAVLDAASHYGVDPDELAYEPVEKRGLSKRRKIVIRIDPDRPLKSSSEKNEETSESPPEVGVEPASVVEEPEVAAPEGEDEDEDEGREEVEDEVDSDDEEVPVAAKPRRPARAEEGMEIRLPATVAEWFALLPEADVDERVAAERWTTELLDLAGLDLTPRVRQGEEQLEIALDGPDAEWLGDDDGEVLLALQHLLPRLMQSDLERLVSCRVDCGGFQLLREERLRARAHWAAEEVRSEGRSVTLEPMAPADRRIIHLALVNDATVDTESLGRGYFKRVSVRPS